jgi:hypothetical protein
MDDKNKDNISATNDITENEQDILKTLKEEAPPSMVPSISNIDNTPVITKLSFNDFDSILDTETGKIDEIEAPKTLDRLEEISTSRAIQRKLDEEDDDDDDDRIKIHTENIDLNDLDVFDFDHEGGKMSEDVMLDGIEEL